MYKRYQDADLMNKLNCPSFQSSPSEQYKYASETGDDYNGQSTNGGRINSPSKHNSKPINSPSENEGGNNSLFMFSPYEGKHIPSHPIVDVVFYSSTSLIGLLAMHSFSPIFNSAKLISSVKAIGAVIVPTLLDLALNALIILGIGVAVPLSLWTTIKVGRWTYVYIQDKLLLKAEE